MKSRENRPKATKTSRSDLQRLRRATGRVVEVDGGSAVPSVEVSTHRSARAAAAVSDANGFFVINGVGRLFYSTKEASHLGVWRCRKGRTSICHQSRSSGY